MLDSFCVLTAAAKSLQSCPTLQPHRWQPTRLPRPWDSPGKNTGVGCHFLLQCVKVKSEREVSQSCPTLSDPMDCSLPGSSIHGIFQARVLEWDAIAFSCVLTSHLYILLGEVSTQIFCPFLNWGAFFILLSCKNSFLLIVGLSFSFS